MTDSFACGVTELVVLCKSSKRYFDLDAVRTEHTVSNGGPLRGRAAQPAGMNSDSGSEWEPGERLTLNPAGAPPLDWWMADAPRKQPEPGGSMGSARFITGDVFEVLATLEDGSVDLILTSPPFLALRSYLPADHPDKGREIGSEPSPGAFIDMLCRLTEEWARVLAPHGSICVELGDTYSGSGESGWERDKGEYRREIRSKRSAEGALQGVRDLGRGWPLAKSLCLIPELYRIALVYGFNPLTGRTTPRWRARNVCRWCRPNPPVGALGDKFRPATSEMVVACKSGNRYFDLDAVRTEHQARDTRGEIRHPRQMRGRVGTDGENNPSASGNNPAGAPPLDWWNIPTQPYKGAHYATWPEQLCVTPIEAMCPRKVCRTCGKPSERITETDGYVTNGGLPARLDMMQERKAGDGVRQFSGTGDNSAHKVAHTVGWSDCGHDNWRPGIVLDPFAGSGTTLAVAVGHGRDAIGIDLDSRNADLARERVGLFLTVEEHYPEPWIDVPTGNRL